MQMRNSVNSVKKKISCEVQLKILRKLQKKFENFVVWQKIVKIEKQTVSFSFKKSNISFQSCLIFKVK